MNILVTGASKGIGKVIASELSDLGTIFISGRNESALKDIGEDRYCVCDLASEPEKLMEFINEKKIDVLVNNAGEYIYGEIDKMSLDDMARIYRTNLLAPSLLISAAVAHMKMQKWGRVINIGSISGVMGEANASLYSASKAGLLGLTKALALELAEFKITVNTINPGWVDTDLGNTSIEEGEFSREEILECIPQRRFVEPIEVAQLCKYLISDAARGVTGQGINLCAGLSVGI